MKRCIPQNIEDLENSQWAEMVKNPKAQNRVIRDAGNLIQKLGKNSPVAKRAKDALELITSSRGGELMSARNVLVLAAALAYFVFPMDIIPDFIPVVGWLDDIGVLALALGFIIPGKNSQTEEALSVDETVIENLKASLPDNWSDSSLQDELDSMEMDVESLGDDALIKNWTDLRQSLQDPLRRVVFTGGFSAGKSSLINRLLGEELLPVSPLPCTRALTSIMYGTEAHVSIEQKDGSIIETKNLSILRNDEAMVNANEIVVFLPNKMLRNGLTLVDTCGLEHSGLNEREFSELPHAAALVFVKSLEIGGVNEAEAHFCTEATNSLTSDHIIIALNKTDIITKQQLTQAETEVRKFFVDKGLINIKIISTCSQTEGEDAGVEALRAELIKRAAFSMQGDHQRMVQAQMRTLNKQISQGKAARAELERLSAEEQSRAKVQAAKYVERRIDHFQQLALKANNRFEAALHIFVSETLLPSVTQLANSLPLNEQYAPAITSMIRDSLATYIKKEVSDIAVYFDIEWKAYSENDIKIFTANLAPELPPMNDELLNKIGRYLLPGTSIAAFFIMSTFGWLTGPALPLLVLHKMGIGEKLVGLWKDFGPSANARAEFINAIKNEMNNVERDICHAIRSEVISPIVEKQIENLRKSIA